MNIDKNTPRFAGAAFLLQAVASAIAGLILLRPLIVSGNIIDSMANMSNSALQVRAGIVVEMITVIALIILSVLLFVILKKQNMKIALVALGLRLTEVALLAVSRIATFTLLRISQAFVIEGHPAYLQTLGNLAYESQEFTYSLSMVFFTLGGTLFYYLFFKSEYVPRALAIFGLIAAPLALVGELFGLFGFDVPLVVFLPNLPFELAIGIWLLVKGIRDTETA
ncbi:MAG: DUF4386 domain-containing protein [Chloroflexi bacterium]|nr:DUF4386 domain-containing protein [Chloroflexota bacterium]